MNKETPIPGKKVQKPTEMKKFFNDLQEKELRENQAKNSKRRGL